MTHVEGELGHHTRGHASYGAFDPGRVQQLLVLLFVRELGIPVRRETVPGTLGGDEDRRATGSDQRLDETTGKKEERTLPFSFGVMLENAHMSTCQIPAFFFPTMVCRSEDEKSGAGLGLYKKRKESSRSAASYELTFYFWHDVQPTQFRNRQGFHIFRVLQKRR